MKGMVVALALVLTGSLTGTAQAQTAEKMVLSVARQPHPKQTYKCQYKMAFYMEKAAELGIATQSNNLQLDVIWEWTQEETMTPEGPEAATVLARIVQASQASLLNRQNTTSDIYPWSLEDLKGTELAWKVDPRGQVTDFAPVQDPPKIAQATVASELRLIAESDFYPALPENAVSVGDSWTLERIASSTFEEFQSFEARIRSTSTLKIKGMKKKGDRDCAEIEETRTIGFRKWLYSGYKPFTLEGEGKGKGSWLFDAENGTVVAHEMRMDIEPRPTLIGETEPRNIVARLTLWIKRELVK